MKRIEWNWKWESDQHYRMKKSKNVKDDWRENWKISTCRMKERLTKYKVKRNKRKWNRIRIEMDALRREIYVA